jgi:hypothetical protein
MLVITVNGAGCLPTQYNSLLLCHYLLTFHLQYRIQAYTCHAVLHPIRYDRAGEKYILMQKWFKSLTLFTLSNPVFLPPAYSPAPIYFGWERCWWITCNYPTVLKEKNINRNRKSTTCAICWLKSVLHEEKR